jgi:conjugative relaxase-like TrwC/TraI family protein
MLRVVAHKSAAAASRYYTDGLRREDYYSEGQEIIGKWNGAAAEKLGLKGDVKAEGFAALIENRHPETGKRLTARQNADRVVGYDLNFHAPKSLSVLYALTGNQQIVTAFREAVEETMREIERKAATRIRKKGQQENRVTGNLAWAEFVHFTSRPVGGIPDPHLHVHCFAGNATWDEQESRWKAANFRAIKEDAPYSESLFHSKLAAKLIALGYETERTKQGWEVKGIDRRIIDKFSRRTAEIERIAKEKGITDPREKDQLGAASRAGKRHGLSFQDLVGEWRSRLTLQESEQISRLGTSRDTPRPRVVVTPYNAMDDACSKLFSKQSIVPARRLVAETLRFGIGHVSEQQASDELRRRAMIQSTVKGEVFCTSLEVVAEEVALIHFVRTGRSMHAPLCGKKLEFGNESLAAEQQAAVRHVLHSRDQVIGVRGAAGVGKTTLMKEVVSQLEGRGHKVFAFAPSAVASRETLREEGFAGADTVAHLLANPEMQERVKGHVIWVDEAGLLGVRDMWRLMKLAGSDTRVILTGDTAQHAPVARGDAFRLMQRFAGMKVVEVTSIRRQKREEYKRAVLALSKGDLRTGFRRLDELGAIAEIEDAQERYKKLAADYLDLSVSGSAPLVVSPTHSESEKATEAIRLAKREAGKLGLDRQFIQFKNLQWEEADRRHAENYSPGQLVQFHQNVPGITRGEIFRITDRNAAGEVRMVSSAGTEFPLPLEKAANFQVFEERRIALARGDRIRITRNGKSDDGRRLSNGSVFAIEDFRSNGKIVLNTGAVLAADHGHLAYGYCQTSHSSQGKTVKDVLVAQSADSFLASSREQFYVSISRGKDSIRIYTDDRRGLQEAVGATSVRKSGVELAGFTARELASPMSSGLDGKKWREWIRGRDAEDLAKDHVKALLKGREDQSRKDLEAKSAAKGSEAGAKKKAGASPLRTGRMPKPEAVQAKKGEGEDNSRLDRVKSRFSAARTHFKALSDRLKDTLGRRTKTSASEQRLGDVAQIAKHRVKQQESDATRAKQAKAKAPLPAPAVARRVR